MSERPTGIVVEFHTSVLLDGPMLEVTHDENICD